MGLTAASGEPSEADEQSKGRPALANKMGLTAASGEPSEVAEDGTMTRSVCVNEHYEPECGRTVAELRNAKAQRKLRRENAISPIPGCTRFCSYNRHLDLVHIPGCQGDFARFDPRSGVPRPCPGVHVAQTLPHADPPRSSGKELTAADELGERNGDLNKPTFESTSDAKPPSSNTRRLYGRRRRWAEGKRARDHDIMREHMNRHEDQDKKIDEDVWDPLNEMLFGPRDKLINRPCRPLEELRREADRAPPIEPPGGWGITARWFDGLVAPIFDPDEGVDSREVMGITDYQSVHGDWIRISSVMDSGACKPVCPPDMLPGHPVRENAASRAKKELGSASGHGIKMHGEQQFKAYTDNGLETEVLFQVCDVTCPLVSISAICDKGNRVIFGRGGGVVQNLSTGAEVPFERRGGVYAMGLWVRRAPPSAGSEAPFGRR